MRKIISLIIRIIISAVILFLIFKQVDLGKIIQIVYRINKSYLFFVFLLTLLIYFIGFLRWKMLLIGLGLSLDSFLIFKAFCIGYFSNLFFPSTIGGDFIRSVDLSLRTQKPRLVVASVILDRLSGYSALVIIATLALVLGYRLITDIVVFFVLGIILVLLLGILAILFNNFLFFRAVKLLRYFGKAGEILSKLHYEIYNFRNQKKIIIKNIIYSLVIQLIIPFLTYLISLALGTRINPVYFFILTPIIGVISALPISVAGLGLREASTMYFFTRVGVSGEVALAIALLSFFINFLLAVIGGSIYVLTFSYRRLQCN